MTKKKNWLDKIKPFKFPPLASIEQDLINAGKSKKEIESLLAGLATLPEYNKPVFTIGIVVTEMFRGYRITFSSK